MGGQGTSFSPGGRRRCVPGGLCSHPGRVLLRGGGAFDCRSTASVRSEVRSTHRARPLAPGAGAPTGWGGAFDCRSTASVRSEVKPKHRACPVRTRGGCSYRVGVTRSVVGAPPRCEAKSNQYSEPVRSHPGRVLLQGGVARSIVGAPPRCESSQTNTPSPPIRTRGGCSYGCCAEMKKPPHLSMRGLWID